MNYLAVIIYPNEVDSLRKHFDTSSKAALWIGYKLAMFRSAQMELNIDLPYPYGFSYAVLDVAEVVYQNEVKDNE